MSLLAAAFAACSEDYPAESGPQANPQESALQSSAITFNPADVTTIDLSQYANDEGIIDNDSPIALGSVSVAEGAMPANTIMKAKIDISRQQDFAEFIKVDAESMAETNVVSVLPSTLQAAYYNSFTHNPNETTMYVRVSLFTVTNGTSEAMVGNPAASDFYRGNYTVSFTPVNEKGIYISTAYYAVQKDLEGNWTETVFEHSEVDVYDDPVFTCSIEALKNEAGVRFDTEYYIVAAEDLDAFMNGNKTVAFGKGEGEGVAKGGDPFVGPATDGASKYNLTLNMEKQAIVIEPEIHFYCYYLFANPSKSMKKGEGETNRHYMFYKTNETTFTYTTLWPGLPDDSQDRPWFNIKIWERDDMNANNETKAWGYDGKATGKRAMKGKLKLPGQWLGPETPGWYTLTIVMDEENDSHTYQFTAIDAPEKEYEHISIIGTINGSDWGTDYDLVQCKGAPHNWCLLDFELTEDAELKFRANHEWNGDWGGDGSQPVSPVVYTITTGNENIKVPAGKYDFYLNDITGDWIILKGK